VDHSALLTSNPPANTSRTNGWGSAITSTAYNTLSEGVSAVSATVTTTVASSMNTALSMLPSSLSSMVEPRRDFAHITLKTWAPAACSFIKSDEQELIIVVSDDERVCKYSIPEGGGVCRLEREYALFDRPSEHLSIKIHQQPAANTHSSDFHPSSYTPMNSTVPHNSAPQINFLPNFTLFNEEAPTTSMTQQYESNHKITDTATELATSEIFDGMSSQIFDNSESHQHILSGSQFDIYDLPP
jgi:hypothetical protein